MHVWLVFAGYELSIPLEPVDHVHQSKTWLYTKSDRVHTPQVVRKSDCKRRRENSSIEVDWRDQWYNYLEETKRIEQRHHDRVFPEKSFFGTTEYTKFDCAGEHCPCRVKQWRFDNKQFWPFLQSTPSSLLDTWAKRCWALYTICSDLDPAEQQRVRCELLYATEFAKYDGNGSCGRGALGNGYGTTPPDTKRKEGRDPINPYFFWNQRLWNKSGFADKLHVEPSSQWPPVPVD